MQDVIKGFDAISSWACALSQGICESGRVHALMLKIETFTELPPKLGLINKGCAISVIYIEVYIWFPAEIIYLEVKQLKIQKYVQWESMEDL